MASASEQIKENEKRKNGSGREENARNHIIEETLKEKKIIPALWLDKLLEGIIEGIYLIQKDGVSRKFSTSISGAM